MSGYTTAAHKKYALKLFIYMLTRVFIPIYLFAIVVGVITNESTSGDRSTVDYVVYLVTRDWIKMLVLLGVLAIVCVVWGGVIARRPSEQNSGDTSAR
jgi:hypothetical protein